MGVSPSAFFTSSNSPAPPISIKSCTHTHTRTHASLCLHACLSAMSLYMLQLLQCVFCGWYVGACVCVCSREIESVFHLPSPVHTQVRVSSPPCTARNSGLHQEQCCAPRPQAKHAARVGFWRSRPGALASISSRSHTHPCACGYKPKTSCLWTLTPPSERLYTPLGKDKGHVDMWKVLPCCVAACVACTRLLDVRALGEQ